ncbi:MAG: hypothetical protein OJI67_22835 [Prosthecobacter sp.]|nr:hypothetical protein [Prosthecobacter sp.]
MKFYLLLSACLFLSAAMAEDEVLSYSTKPSSRDYPFPTALPAFPEGQASRFNWKRYIEESVSDGDRVFRSHIAFSNGFLAQDLEVMGVQESAGDEAARNRIAADEVVRSCEILESLYRKRLEKDSALLLVLEDFITHHRKAIEASITLVGGSWDGGSGARVAYPAARCDAFLYYRSALLNLRSSLHFQDMPEVVFPMPTQAPK